jgi:hypothetical protein
MLDGRAVELNACWDIGVSMFVGKVEGRLEQGARRILVGLVAPCCAGSPFLGFVPPILEVAEANDISEAGRSGCASLIKRENRSRHMNRGEPFIRITQNLHTDPAGSGTSRSAHAKYRRTARPDRGVPTEAIPLP